MKSIIERINTNDFETFHGGIHPPEQKFLTNNKPIRSLPLPPVIILPLQQHIGQAGELIVKTGDLVLKGQALTQYSHAMTLPVHAPTSGKITAIKDAVIAHPSGIKEPCIFITPDGNDTCVPRNICSNYTLLSIEKIIDKISQAGISGMGGAGFPTHIKINSPHRIETLIINAAECEPYITADDLLIREQTPTIIDGINILCKLLNPQHVLIGIEDNKPDAIKVLQAATQNNSLIKVCILPTKYPTGGEKQLIQCLTGQEVPSGVLPNKMGIIMQNVATCFAIAEAVIHDIPLTRRVVTISGAALKKPQNIWALIGTPVEYLLEHCGYNNQHKKHIIMGGPMMGYSLPSGKVPIVKTSNCVLAPSEAEIPSAMYQDNNEVECIRCGQCAEVCPSQLLPQELQWSAKAKDHTQLEKLNLFDCIECGACAYVCPSQIPLVHYYRIGKAEIRQQKLLDLQAEKAKVRFEARKLRLEKEKMAREEKHKKAAEARKARMNAGTPEAQGEKSAVAAALARVKAKKAQATSGNTNTEVHTGTSADDSPKSAVAAAIARAKAKKLAAQINSQSKNKTISDSSELATEKETTKSTEDKKAKIAAAIAKAKAKKAETKATEAHSPESEAPKNVDQHNFDKSNVVQVNQTSNTVPPAEAKKAKIAAAIAKAKAKKALNTSMIDSPDSNLSMQNSVPTSIQASMQTEATQVKKDTPEQSLESETTSPNVASTAADKKAKIALAIAKAKAKKQQQTESL